MNHVEIIKLAQKNKTIIPAFNIPHLPMAKPIAQAIKDENAMGMIQVARLEWEKFSSKSLEHVAEAYHKYADPAYVLLHLDHVPVLDEDYIRVDYMPLLERAIQAGFGSVMVDGSRLNLEENIAVSKEVALLAHENGAACEAELGAVVGHEKDGMNQPYDELFATKQGFTKTDEAARFAAETGCDWLSVAVGSIHGAIAESVRNQKKPEARLDIGHIAALRKATGNLPLVLHGGSGINQDCILQAIGEGICKINVGTELRQAYEFAILGKQDVAYGREAVYLCARAVIRDFLRISGNHDLLCGSTVRTAQ